MIRHPGIIMLRAHAVGAQCALSLGEQSQLPGQFVCVRAIVFHITSGSLGSVSVHHHWHTQESRTRETSTNKWSRVRRRRDSALRSHRAAREQKSTHTQRATKQNKLTFSCFVVSERASAPEHQIAHQHSLWPASPPIIISQSSSSSGGAPLPDKQTKKCRVGLRQRVQ